jgi:hypothetical protein
MRSFLSIREMRRIDTIGLSNKGGRLFTARKPVNQSRPFKRVLTVDRHLCFCLSPHAAHMLHAIQAAAGKFVITRS